MLKNFTKSKKNKTKQNKKNSLFVPVVKFSSISRDKRHIYFMLLF